MERQVVRRTAAIGSLPSDTPDERLRKSALVLSSLLITFLSFVWVGTYAALGLWARRSFRSPTRSRRWSGSLSSRGRSATASIARARSR